jgi:hypothetical protein
VIFFRKFPRRFVKIAVFVVPSSLASNLCLGSGTVCNFVGLAFYIITSAITIKLIYLKLPINWIVFFWGFLWFDCCFWFWYFLKREFEIFIFSRHWKFLRRHVVLQSSAQRVDNVAINSIKFRLYFATFPLFFNSTWYLDMTALC